MAQEEVCSERSNTVNSLTNLERSGWSALIEGINDLVIDISELLQGLLEEEDVTAMFGFGHSLQNCFLKRKLFSRICKNMENTKSSTVAAVNT